MIVYHHAAKSGKQCFLCGGKDRTIAQYKNIQVEVRSFIALYHTTLQQNFIKVYRFHVMEAQRYCNSEGYVPNGKGSAPMGHLQILIKGVVIQFVPM